MRAWAQSGRVGMGRLARPVTVCDNERVMRTRAVIVVILLLSLVAAPVAMAADGCSGMSSVCGAPCSAPCVSAPTAATDAVLVPISTLTLVPVARVVPGALQAPDAPPKSLPA
jgi:hypothetical protein